MPFTFSHTAVVIPFLYLPRKWISITGLFIGSMGPDFEYFLRMRIKSEYSHTLSGIFWFDIPVCLVVAFIFHNLIRNSLIDNLPLFLKERFIRYKADNWNIYFRKNIGVVLFSILIGVLSHCIWDSFTHPTGFFVNYFPVLKSQVHISTVRFPIYKIIQYGSGLIGGLLMVSLIFFLPRQKSVCEKSISITYWLLFFISVFIITSIRIAWNPVTLWIGNLAVTLITASFWAFVIAGLTMSLRK